MGLTEVYFFFHTLPKMFLLITYGKWNSVLPKWRFILFCFFCSLNLFLFDFPYLPSQTNAKLCLCYVLFEFEYLLRTKDWNLNTTKYKYRHLNTEIEHSKYGNFRKKCLLWLRLWEFHCIFQPHRLTDMNVTNTQIESANL